MIDSNQDDPNRPTLRFNVTISPLDRTRLKQAALDVGTPAAVLARTLINYGIDNLHHDPALRAVVDAAAEAEHNRRVDAASKGGKVGGGSNRKTSEEKETPE